MKKILGAAAILVALSAPAMAADVAPIAEGTPIMSQAGLAGGLSAGSVWSFVVIITVIAAASTGSN